MASCFRGRRETRGDGRWSDGADGAPGSVWRSGSGAPAGGLGIVGDWYLNIANGDVYEKTGASTYTLRDNLTGPQGEPGEAGEGGAGVTDHGALTGLSDDDHSIIIPTLVGTLVIPR